MSMLNIPYRSQWAADASLNSADCGPTCLAMIMNHFGVNITPDRIYDYLPPKKPDEFTYFSELKSVAEAHQLSASRHAYDDQASALNNLKAHIDAGRPVIALVKYQPWIGTTGNQYEWGHFVVVTGYDGANVYINDPLFGLWVKPAEKGARYAMTNDLFAAGWGGFPANENPNWVCLAISRAGIPAPAPAPGPTVAPPPAAAAPPPPAAAAPTLIMDDVNRRIRALAAYRWAEAPNFADEAAVKLWRDHLGDWGLGYDQYIVQSGDTLSALAGRHYGQQHRWPAIKAYNNLQRDGLWVGETIAIPHLGTTGAHNDPALPSDTIDFAKAVALDDLADPELPANDYNAVGSKSVGIGFSNE